MQDEITTPTVVPLEWHLHTAARVRLLNHGKTALLLQSGNNGTIEMFAKILSPPSASFVSQSSRSVAQQMQHAKTTDLTITMKLPAGKTTVIVTITRANHRPTQLSQLQKWH